MYVMSVLSLVSEDTWRKLVGFEGPFNFKQLIMLNMFMLMRFSSTLIIINIVRDT